MTTNRRQLQSFDPNPLIIWKQFSGADSYTFKWKENCSTGKLLFEETLMISTTIEELPDPPAIPKKLKLYKITSKDPATQQIVEVFHSFIYSTDLPSLNELVPYTISATANNDGKSCASASAEIVILESKPINFMKTFTTNLENLSSQASENKKLEEDFYKFSTSLLMGDTIQGAPRWISPRNCYGIEFSP